MHSTLQRLNVISSFALSVVMALAAVVALTGLWHPSVQGSVKVNDLQVVHGRRRFHGDHRTQDFLEADVNVLLDARPLFNWNTKQVFLSITGNYSTPYRAQNHVTIWDKILKSKQDALVDLKEVKNKYGFREVSKTFRNVSAIDFHLRWNVMPYVGVLEHGKTDASKQTKVPLRDPNQKPAVKLIQY